MNMPIQERWSEAARQRRLGYPVIDLEPNLKFARRSISNVLSLSDIDEVFQEDRNIGILLEPRSLLVFDADSEEAENWLEDQGLMNSNTIVQSPHGKHVYYRHDCEGLKTKLHFGNIPLDIKATGHIVSPGSVVEGKAYEWLVGPRHVGCLPTVPERIMALLRESMESDGTTKKVQKDVGKVVGKVRSNTLKITNPRAYCLRIPSVQGQGGSKGLVRVVCVLRDCGWSPDQILEFVAGEWNDQCAVPRWSNGEIIHAINRHCG